MRHLLLVLLILSGGPLAAEELTVLCGSFPPYCYQKDGKPAGIAVEILQAVTDAGGPSFQFDFSVPWARVQEVVQSDSKALILPLTRVPVRVPHYLWVTELYTWKGHLVTYGAQLPPETIQKALNLRVGVSNGSVLVQTLRSLGFSRIETVSSDKLNANKLANGRLDAWVVLDSMDQYYFETLGLDRSLIHIGPQVGEKFEHYLGAGPGFSPETAQRIDQLVRRLKEGGKIAQILAKFHLN